MVHALNQLHIDVSCFGNHEFDYPHDETVKLSRQCNFPWLMGNIRFTETNELLGFGQQYHIIEKGGVKIGVYGVAGEDWIGILAEFA
jgi:5'-nucleotidase